MREVTFLLILSLLFVAPARGQSPNATINGIVLDPSGAAIVDCTLEMRQPGWAHFAS